MLQWDKKLVAKVEKKRHHYFFSIVLIAVILGSLFVAVPEEEIQSTTRPISIEEQEGIILALDRLSDVIPTQALTLQNWMNKIVSDEIIIHVKISKGRKIFFDKGILVFPSRFFEEDPITQQKNLSDALGMKFDYSKAAEIAFSRE